MDQNVGSRILNLKKKLAIKTYIEFRCFSKIF